MPKKFLNIEAQRKFRYSYEKGVYVWSYALGNEKR